MKVPDSKNHKSDSTSKVWKIFRKIAKKSADGDYIYRGEPECFKKVSSNLYREYDYIDITIVERAILDEAKKFTHETDEFEILTQLQHYGGQTNLIDFTTDYLIALFFACDGSHDKDGRIILQKRGSVAIHIKNPRNPRNRVIAQKSLFVRPPQGFLEPDKEITIPKGLKQPILEHLQMYYGLSTETVYNDLHGFIKHRNIHRKAKMQFYRGLTFYKKGDHDKSICHFTKSIALNPNISVCYNNRGTAYLRKGEYHNAIQDYNDAIKLKPYDAEVHYNRGEVWLHLKKWKKARSDLTTARNRGMDIIAAFHNDYKSVADFEQKNGITLPQDLAAMLGG